MQAGSEVYPLPSLMTNVINSVNLHVYLCNIGIKYTLQRIAVRIK